jgi:hypothetical protein
MDEEQIADHGWGDCLRGRAPQPLEYPDDERRDEAGEEYATDSGGKEKHSRDDEGKPAAANVGHGNPEDVAQPEHEDVELVTCQHTSASRTQFRGRTATRDIRSLVGRRSWGNSWFHSGSAGAIDAEM